MSLKKILELVEEIFEIFVNNKSIYTHTDSIYDELYEIIENLSNDEIEVLKDTLKNPPVKVISFSRRVMLRNNIELFEELIEKRKIEIRNNKLNKLGI